MGLPENVRVKLFHATFALTKPHKAAVLS
jgi:hypothetical protein